MRNQRKKRWNNAAHIALLLVFYALLLLRNGYVFGGNDHAEVMSYAKSLKDNSLYFNDLYIKNMSNSVWNERFLFSKILSFFVGHNFEWLIFGLHAFFSVLILGGGFRIAKFFIRHDFWVWTALFFVYIVLGNINLGGNELYYNSLLAGTIATAFCIWSFYYLLKNELALAWVGVACATFFQPLLGVQFFGLFICIQLIISFLQKNKNLNQFYFPFVWLLTAGIYVFYLTKKYNICSENINGATAWEVMLFRAPHHYFPTDFGWINYLILMPIFGFGTWFFSREKGREGQILCCFFALVGLGALIYTFGVLGLKNKTLMSLQWFSTTIWLELFSGIALFSFLENQISNIRFLYFLNAKIFKINVLKIGISFIVISTIYFLMSPNQRLFKSKIYDFPNFEKSLEVDISEKVKLLTPKNAVFITPTNTTYFKYFSERSSFVDFKAIAHRCDAISEWFDRTKKVYGFERNRRGFAYSTWANEQFLKRDEAFFENLRAREGVTHVLAFKNMNLNFSKITENQQFIIYEIK
ncbi:MAG: hypothetical protein RL757_1530 [Bacteroidota bacterium]|jgi:hypothetical protein